MGARFGAPRFELADIVRQHRPALEARLRFGPEQRRALTDIAQCRTAVLGGHLDECEACCGYAHPSYNSCRNRHCPKCQALNQEKWIEAERRRLLDVPHFHVVFTLPAELRPLAAFAPTVVYALLFSCAGATLREFGRSRLDAMIGATLVLHTWTKELLFHPHVHAIVSGGGLRDDDTWTPARQDFLFPVKAMSRVIRGKMRATLRAGYYDGVFHGFNDFQDPEGFDRLSARLAQKNWYVHAKRSFSRAKYVVEYLGRYTHRVGLSNTRILSLSDDCVVIRTRGDGRAAMTPPELLARLVRHVLPTGFHKIRHFGLYASPRARARACFTLPLTVPPPLDYRERLFLLTGRDVRRCPRCGCGIVARALPTARAPPARATS
jgi:hypothetical protein